MNKILIAGALLLSSSAFANSEKACEEAAVKAVVGFVKGLGQDVSVKKVELISSYAKDEIANETYAVNLKGNGFVSQETEGTWIIKLNDLGDGCSYSSLKLNRYGETEKQEVVEFSSKKELLNLVQAINSVNGGSASGVVTDPAKIECVLTSSERFCAVSKLP
jgi:hypothetical protein